MLALDFALHWLKGTWHTPPPPSPTPTLRDIEGTVVNIGDIVRVECIVISQEFIDFSNGTLVLGILHPNWSSSMGPPLPTTPNLPIIRVVSIGVLRN